MKFYYYQITNIKNGSFYIGITTNYLKRQREHFNQLRKGNHCNYKMQKDFNLYGAEAFEFKVIEEKECTIEEGYDYEYQLIQKLHATDSYNIAEGGKLNPVYSPQIREKITLISQSKYDNILQYEFKNNHFTFIKSYHSLREVCRLVEGTDFRALQNATKATHSHCNYYWIKESEKEEWLNKFLKRHTCCIAKINEDSGEIEDTALTINEFAIKYNTTYNRIYASLWQNNRCERKYKFIRITAKQFAEINNLSL